MPHRNHVGFVSRLELADVVIKHPTHQASWTCAASGHAAALPRPAMNSRRRFRDLPRWSGKPIVVRGVWEPAGSTLAATAVP